MVQLRNKTKILNNILKNENNLIKDNNYDYFQDIEENEGSSFKSFNENEDKNDLDSFDEDFLYSEDSQTIDDDTDKKKKIKKLKTKRGFDIRKMNFILNQNIIKNKNLKKKRKIKYNYIQSDRPIFIHELYSQKELIKMAIKHENEVIYDDLFDIKNSNYSNIKYKRFKKKIDKSQITSVYKSFDKGNEFLINKSMNYNKLKYKAKDIIVDDTGDIPIVKIKFEENFEKNYDKTYFDPTTEKSFENLLEFKYNRYDYYNKNICNIKNINL